MYALCRTSMSYVEKPFVSTYVIKYTTACVPVSLNMWHNEFMHNKIWFWTCFRWYIYITQHLSSTLLVCWPWSRMPDLGTCLVLFCVMYMHCLLRSYDLHDLCCLFVLVPFVCYDIYLSCLCFGLPTYCLTLVVLCFPCLNGTSCQGVRQNSEVWSGSQTSEYDPQG